MSTIESDYPGPGQGMALEMIIDLASKLYEQGNTLTVRWVPGHKGVIGNEAADTYSKEAARTRALRAASREAMERISLSFLKRRAAESASAHWRDPITRLNRGR